MKKNKKGQVEIIEEGMPIIVAIVIIAIIIFIALKTMKVG